MLGYQSEVKIGLGTDFHLCTPTERKDRIKLTSSLGVLLEYLEKDSQLLGFLGDYSGLFGIFQLEYLLSNQIQWFGVLGNHDLDKYNSNFNGTQFKREVIDRSYINLTGLLDGEHIPEGLVEISPGKIYGRQEGNVFVVYTHVPLDFRTELSGEILKNIRGNKLGVILAGHTHHKNPVIHMAYVEDTPILQFELPPFLRRVTGGKMEAPASLFELVVKDDSVELRQVYLARSHTNGVRVREKPIVRYCLRDYGQISTARMSWGVLVC